jgi:hypothetical protein
LKTANGRNVRSSINQPKKKPVPADFLTLFSFAHYIGANGCTALEIQPILVRKYPPSPIGRHAIERQTPASGVERFFSEPWFGFCSFLVSALYPCAKRGPE